MIAVLCALAIGQIDDVAELRIRNETVGRTYQLVAFQDHESDPSRTEAKYGEFNPSQDDLPTKPPEGTIVLFDGENHKFVSMSGEQIDWPITDGSLISSKGGNRSNHIVSQIHFRDADIHVEFSLPDSGSGNSGVYIHGNYEMQILRASKEGQELTQNDVGSLYGFAKPLVRAGRRPNEWQVYDIRYRAPIRNAKEEIIEEGSITAWLNGKMVQHGTRVGEPRSKYHPYRYGTTDYLQAIWKRQRRTMTGPLFLQDHGHAVRFRNVWIKPLDDEVIEYKAIVKE